MYPTSAAFATAVAGSHVATALAVVTDPAGNPLATLPVDAGGITVDETRAVRRTCTVTVINNSPSLIPTSATSLLHPNSGNELRLYRGIAGTPDGPVPLGVFRLSKPQIRRSTDGTATITLTGNDRASYISRVAWLAPYTIAAGTNLATAVHDAVDSRLPGLTYNLAVTTVTVPATVFGASPGANDPWADITSLATAAGMELYFDVGGVVVMRPVPDPALITSAITFAEGPNCTVSTLERDLDETRYYNTVVVSGQGSGVTPPVTATSQVTPAPAVAIPYFYTSSTITTTAQAQAAADALLLVYQGALEEITAIATPDPRLDAGDIARVTSSALQIAANYAIQSLTIPLDPGGSMSVTFRPRLTT